MKLEVSGQIFGKKAKISSFFKIRPGGAKLFHADRQTGRNDVTNGRFFTNLRKHLKPVENAGG